MIIRKKPGSDSVPSGFCGGFSLSSRPGSGRPGGRPFTGGCSGSLFIILGRVLVERDHLILEELVGALGLPGDHLKYRDSILYDGWTVTRELSEVDWQMLEILYSGELRAGMTEKEASDLLWGR
jgi:hypothetical protein